MEDKTLDNTDVNQAKDQVSDLEVFGDGDGFKLICKASSKKEGWMKSTKAMEIEGVGCVVQVTTQQKNPDGSYAVAEALTFVPGVMIQLLYKDDGPVTGRVLISAQRAAFNRSQ